MDKRLGFAMVLSASALVWVGCDENPPPADGGCPEGTICLGDAGTDAATPDSGPDGDSGPTPECPLTSGREIGAPCRMNTCTSPLVCERQESGGIPTVLRDLTTAGPTINITFNPGGGVCTAACQTDDDCGDCASCVSNGDGTASCEYACVPTLDDNGGCRTGYSCNLGGGTCQAGCATDDICKVVGTHDANGDGRPDAYIYDPEYPATCDLNTGRCEVMGTAGAVPGDACEEDTDCEDNGLCITGEGWGDGYCARIGCGYEGFDCAAGASCDIRNLGVNICMQGCAVGAETDAQALGADGQGEGCQPGHMCSWAGTAGPTADPNGSCLPGNYNDVTVPNVGGACQTAEDCYSPYGNGRCLWGTDESEGLRATGDRVGSGMCVVQNCAQFMEGTAIVDGLLPGVNTTTSVCDYAAGERCVNFGETDAPFNLCITTCTTGDECAPGYGCIQFFSDGTRACWPACDQNAGDAAYAGCHTGATCQHATSGAPCDANGADNTPNTADDQQCFCSDAGPRPTDAGPGDEDAGTTDDAGTADAGVDGGSAAP